MLEWEPTQSDRFFAAALKFIADREGLTKKQLAKISKRTVRTIEYILALERGAGKETAFALTKELGYTYPQFLRIGQLIMEGIPGEEALTRSIPTTAEGNITMPIQRSSGIGDNPPVIEFLEVPKAQAKLSAGGGCFVEEGVTGKYHFRSDWLRLICSPADAILFDCSGESMWPTIRDKETVLVDRGNTEFQDDKVFAIGIGDNALIKRLRLNADNMIEVISDNPDKKRFPTDVVAPDDIRILGRVRWHAGVM